MNNVYFFHESFPSPLFFLLGNDRQSKNIKCRENGSYFSIQQRSIELSTVHTNAWVSLFLYFWGLKCIVREIKRAREREGEREREREGAGGARAARNGQYNRRRSRGRPGRRPAAPDSEYSSLEDIRGSLLAVRVLRSECGAARGPRGGTGPRRDDIRNVDEGDQLCVPRTQGET